MFHLKADKSIVVCVKGFKQEMCVHAGIWNKENINHQCVVVRSLPKLTKKQYQTCSRLILGYLWVQFSIVFAYGKKKVK